MPNSLLGSEYRFDKESGYILHAQHQRIAEIIKDYNPELELVWIPPDRRDPEDVKPFAVVHNQKDGSQYPVMFLSEDEMDHRVLKRIFLSDMTKARPQDVMNEIEAEEAAKRIMAAKEQEDIAAEKRDFAMSLLRSNKNWYHHNGKVYRS